MKHSAASLQANHLGHADGQDSYELSSVDGLDFAKLFVHAKTYTIKWRGKIDFQHLENEMLVSLSECLGKDLAKRVYGNQTASVRAWFTIVDADDNLGNVDLDRSDDYKLYSQIIEGNSTIRFARFQVTNNDQFLYSISAGYPNETQRSDADIALKLPADKAVTPSLLTWVERHHANNEAFADLDLSQVAKQTTELVGRF